MFFTKFYWKAHFTKSRMYNLQGLDNYFYLLRDGETTASKYSNIEKSKGVWLRRYATRQAQRTKHLVIRFLSLDYCSFVSLNFELSFSCVSSK